MDITKSRMILGAILILLSPFYSTLVAAQSTTIKVGGYEFPPFIEAEDGQYSGVSIEILGLLNAIQEKYNFEFESTSPSRRYQDFDQGKFDLIMFEDISWGWKDKGLLASDVFLTGGEVYITRAGAGKDQSFFDSLQGKSLGVMLGYHYGFADYNSDPVTLREKYNAELNTSFEGNVFKVVRGRVDVGLVTLSYLNKLSQIHLGLEDSLLISKKFDQEYNHTILIRDGIALSVDELNQLLEDAQETAGWSAIWEKYGLARTNQSDGS